MLFWLLIATLIAGFACVIGAVRVGEPRIARFGLVMIGVVVVLFLLRWLTMWL